MGTNRYIKLLILMLAVFMANTELYAQAQKPVYHSVQPKETLYALSVKYKVTVDQIKKWNKLRSNGLQIGQRLIVGFGAEEKTTPNNPPSEQIGNKQYKYHKVLPKQTLYAISKMYGVTTEDLKVWNHLSSNAIFVGQRLIVGVAQKEEQKQDFTEKPVEQPKEKTPEKTTTNNVPTEDKEYTYHKVSPKQTLYTISKMYGVSVQDIRKWNHLNSNAIFVGQRLIVGVNENEEQKQDFTEETVQQPLEKTPEKTETETKPEAVTEKPKEVPKQKEPVEQEADNPYVAYFALIRKGDKAFEEEHYEDALQFFEKASSILPDEKYPVNKIMKIEAILAQGPYTEEQILSGALDTTQQKENPVQAADTVKPEDLDKDYIISVKKEGEEKYTQGVRAKTYHALLKSKPSDFGKVIKYLEPDTEVLVIDFTSNHHDYFKVYYDGKEGWIPEQNIQDNLGVTAFKEKVIGENRD